MTRNEALSNREVDILNILLQEEKPLMASEIVTISGALSINTVQSVLRGLIKKSLIAVVGFEQSGKVFGRTYTATPNAKKQLEKHLGEEARKISKNLPSSLLVSALLGGEWSEETINEIELIIQRKKEELAGE